MLEIEWLATLDYSSRGVEWSLSLLGCTRGSTFYYPGERSHDTCPWVHSTECHKGNIR